MMLVMLQRIKNIVSSKDKTEKYIRCCKEEIKQNNIRINTKKDELIFSPDDDKKVSWKTFYKKLDSVIDRYLYTKAKVELSYLYSRSKISTVSYNYLCSEYIKTLSQILISRKNTEKSVKEKLEKEQKEEEKLSQNLRDKITSIKCSLLINTDYEGRNPSNTKYFYVKSRYMTSSAKTLSTLTDSQSRTNFFTETLDSKNTVQKHPLNKVFNTKSKKEFFTQKKRKEIL